MKTWKAVVGTLLATLVAGGCYDESPERGGGGGRRQERTCHEDACLVEVTREMVVTDPSGWPIPGVRIKLWIPDSGTLAQGYTQAEGSVAFTFTAAPDSLFYLSAQAAGYLPAAIEAATGNASYRTYYVTLVCDGF